MSNTPDDDPCALMRQVPGDFVVGKKEESQNSGSTTRKGWSLLEKSTFMDQHRY